MAVNRIQNTAQVMADNEIIESNTVDTVVKIPPTVYKEVDKTETDIGEILTYSIFIRNDSLLSKKDVVFTDVIPKGTLYLEGSFQVNEVREIPILDNDTLQYTLSSIEPLRTILITFQVKVIA